MRQRKTLPYLVEVGSKIKAIRETKNVSIRELGERCKMDYSSLSRLETGQRNFYILTLKAIADALEVDVKDFL